jgi:hypothetical protein
MYSVLFTMAEIDYLHFLVSTPLKNLYVLITNYFHLNLIIVIISIDLVIMPIMYIVILLYLGTLINCSNHSFGF